MLKFVGCITFVIWVAFLPKYSWVAYLVAAFMLGLWGLNSKLSFWQFIKPVLYAETFVFGIALLSFLQPDGVAVFFSLIIRSSLCVVCMTLFSLTTSFSEFLRLFCWSWYSKLLGLTLALTYRYSFLVIAESERLCRARRSRTFSNSRFETWKLLARDIAQLYLRSSKRGERVYAAMCARGWKL